MDTQFTHPDHTGGAYSAPTHAIAVLRGLLLNRGERKGEGEGRGEGEGERRGRRKGGSSSFALAKKRKVGAYDYWICSLHTAHNATSNCKT